MAESLSRLWTEAMQEEERYVGDLSVKKGEVALANRSRDREWVKEGREGGRGLSRLWTDTLQR